MTDSIDRATVYRGESLLLRWGESHKGRTITLQLDPLEGDNHPFKNLKCGESGTRLMLVAVLIGDDEQPKPAQAEHSAAPPKGVEFKDRPRSQQAGMMLGKPEFCEWLTKGAHLADPNEVLKKALGVKQKRELRTNAEAAKRWDALLTDYDTRSYRR